MKANANLALLKVFVEEGTGFDIVSGGELHRVLAIGADPGKIVFSGVGKSNAEMAAALDAGVLMFNVESEAELEVLAEVARERGKTAGIAIRVNPDVDPKTHRYITTGKRESKFGVDVERAEALAERALDASQRGAPRHPVPHRLADHHRRAVRGGAVPHRGSRLPTAGARAGARVAEHGRGLRHLLRRRPRARARRLRTSTRPPSPDEGPEARDGAGACDHRQRRRAPHTRRVHEGVGGQALRHRRRGDERPHPTEPLRGLSPHLARRGGSTARLPA